MTGRQHGPSGDDFWCVSEIGGGLHGADGRILPVNHVFDGCWIDVRRLQSFVRHQRDIEFESVGLFLQPGWVGLHVLLIVIIW